MAMLAEAQKLEREIAEYISDEEQWTARARQTLLRRRVTML